MTRFLFTGAYGALGYYLLRHLRLKDVHNEYFFGALDNHHGFDFESTDKFEYEKYDEEFHLSEMDYAVKHADFIIHMAEDTVPSMPPGHVLGNNVQFTAQLLECAAAYGTRTVVCCWKEFQQHVPVTPWESSIKWRADLASMFQQGNAVINPLFLPRIISPLHFTMTYGNLVKRFYKAAASDKPADTFGLGEVDDHIEWCWIGHAVEEISRIMRKRTRAPKYVQGSIASAKSVAEYIAARMNVEYIDVRAPKDKLMRRAVYDSDTLENDVVKSAINNCIEVWDAEG